MISHSRRCIFVHIPKTGGTSIENLVWPPPEERAESDLWMGLISGYHNKYQTGGLQHLLARQIREEVGEALFDSYFKFSVVRNPWDRVVSQYLFMQRRPDLCRFIGLEQGASLKRYLDLIGLRQHVQWLPQVDFLFDSDGKPLVDFIGRFEDFPKTVRGITSRLGIFAKVIPHEKRSVRGPHCDYYNEGTRRIVGSLYADDIEAFGYRYEDA